MVAGVPFSPGDAVGIVAPWFVAVVEAERGADLGNALIELAEAPAGGVDELIEVVAGLPVRSLPDFAVGVVELHVVRALIRGTFAALIERNGDVELVDGAGFRTWREMSIDRPADVRIGLAGELGYPAYYWASGGVVPAATIEVATERGSFSASRVAPSSMPPVTRHEPDATSSVAPGEPTPDLGVEPDRAVEADSVGDADLAVDDDFDVELDSEVVEGPNDVVIAGPETESAVHVALDERQDEPSNETLLPLGDDPYADLWFTKARSIEDAAVRAGVPLGDDGEGSVAHDPLGDVGSTTDAAPDLGDHDGHTRSVASLGLSMEGLPPDAEVDPGRGSVPSSPCVNGHPNPPFAVTCRRCLAPVKDVVERVARADAGVLVLPNGERVDVDRTIVVGRNPKADGLYSGDPPRLVGIEDRDVSRTHVVIELSGWTATVTDQDSMNGTEVHLPGKPPEQLRPHTPMAIVVGTRIVLADQVALKLEGG